MSDGLKILSYFLKNLDKTLKILANRKNESLKLAIESNLKKCSINLNKPNLIKFTNSNKNLLKVN